MHKKVVILTGSFNPVTKAHYKALSDAVEHVGASKGLFVATSNEYLINKSVVKGKNRTGFVLSEEVRSNMLKSLNSENSKLDFWGFEIGKESPSTEKTLKRIKKDYKDYELYYLCGADKLHALPHWTNAEEMFSWVHILVFCRGNIDINSIINNSSFLLERKDRITVIETTGDIEDVSSTELRNRFFKNLDYKDLMNESAYKIMSSYKPSDFKAPTTGEIIEDTIKYGGRFGCNAARKLVYKDNLNLFENWNNDLLGDREKVIKNTKVYKNEFVVNSSNNYKTEFDCRNIDCCELALELINEGLNPAILNLASNRRPCGDYYNGADSQEESLCRMSTLSQSLYQFGNLRYKCVRDAKLENIPDVYPMDINFGGIYSPNIYFFRNNIDKYYSLKNKSFECSIITVASLDGRKDRDEGIYCNDDGHLTDEGKVIEKNKIRTIYRIALDNNHDSLVLGAFGCGVYNLLPEEVSKLFRDVLSEKEFDNKFKRITFAIYEGKASSRKVVGKEGKFKAFYDIFKKDDLKHGK